jgi:hypothetical protein
MRQHGGRRADRCCATAMVYRYWRVVMTRPAALKNGRYVILGKVAGCIRLVTGGVTDIFHCVRLPSSLREETDAIRRASARASETLDAWRHPESVLLGEPRSRWTALFLLRGMH